MTIAYVTFMKHAQKVAKTASAGRPVLKGVHHTPDGSLVVTDSHRLYVAKGVSGGRTGEVLDTKTGEIIEGNYPDVSRLIPEESNAKYTVRLDVKQSIDAFKALLAANKLDANAKHPMTTVRILDNAKVVFLTENPTIKSYYEVASFEGELGDEMTFNTQYFADALALFKDAGAVEVIMRYYGSQRPFTLSAGINDELLALLLPIRKG